MTALLVAIASGIAFFALASPNLTAQGAFYDELHQATGAFAYIGQNVHIFVRAKSLGLPVLNMSYSGAIKTALYGVYLRLSGEPFTLWSWRVLGIVFVSLGLVTFVRLGFRLLGSFGTVVFLALFLTDATVLVATRHDWGPIALALALRLLFLGVWLADESRPLRSPWNPFWLGLLVGIATFEKLISAVLLVPLAILLLSRPDRRSLRQWFVAILGGLLGAAPLIAINVAIFLSEGRLVSLESFAEASPWAKPSFAAFLLEYVNLGWGMEVGSVVLGRSSSSSLLVEALPCSILVAIAAGNIALRRRNALFGQSTVLLACYFAIGGALYLVPNTTWIHHWLIGTPFQYLALTLTAVGLWRTASFQTSRLRVIRSALLSTILLWIVAQGVRLAEIEGSLFRGDASSGWHPSLNELGRFAGRRRGHAFFIVASWGLGTQIACFGQGGEGLVYELFWRYRGPEDLAGLANAHRDVDLYVVARTYVIPILPDLEARAQHILADIPTLAGWVEQPVEKDVGALPGIVVRKFVYRGS